MKEEPRKKRIASVSSEGIDDRVKGPEPTNWDKHNEKIIKIQKFMRRKIARDLFNLFKLRKWRFWHSEIYRLDVDECNELISFKLVEDVKTHKLYANGKYLDIKNRSFNKLEIPESLKENLRRNPRKIFELVLKVYKFISSNCLCR